MGAVVLHSDRSNARAPEQMFGALQRFLLGLFARRARSARQGRAGRHVVRLAMENIAQPAAGDVHSRNPSINFSTQRRRDAENEIIGTFQVVTTNL